MSAPRRTYAEVECQTCGAQPGSRCVDAEGREFGFGGAHATRVSEALVGHRCTKDCYERKA